MLFPTTIAGSLPKPEWLAEPNTLWAPWKSKGDELARAKRDATMLAVKLQEDAGVDIVTEGEQARQHFVHGFLEKVEGIDFAHKVEMGIRKDRYKAMVPQVVAPLTLKGRVHADEARVARTHTTRKLKFTLPGPMTIADTVADKYYGDKVKMAFAFAELLNNEAKALQADGVDVIQFDEPAFNVFMDEVSDWGIKALERAAEGLTCTTAVHICYGYGIKANTDWKQTLGSEWRQYEDIFPAIAKSPIQQVAIECRNSKVPLDLLALLPGKVVQAGVIDVASDTVETAEDVVKVIEAVSKFVPKSNIVATTNCGMAPMRRDIAEAKLAALGAGAKLARQKWAVRVWRVRRCPFPRPRLRERIGCAERQTAQAAPPSLATSRLDAAPADIPHSTRAALTAASAACALSIAALCLADSPPSTIAAPCPARSENSPRPAAPSRHRAIAPPASAADAAASCRAPAAPDAARRRSPARECRNAIALLPRRAKAVGIVAAAEEAGAMAGRERGRFVEKEQFGPAPPAHHLAPPAPEFADAGDPRRARPALFQQGLCRGIMDDAAIAGEQAAMRGGDDVAGGRDAVLQGHVDLCEFG